MRQKWADTLTGISIFYMIAMHVSISNEIGTPIYIGCLMYWFMPWFFFKSGLFFKQRGFKDILFKDIKRLLIPYLSWGTIGWFVNFLQHDDSLVHSIYSTVHTIAFTGGVKGNEPLWFLFVLLIVRQLHNLICNKIGSNKTIILVEVSFSFFIAFLLFILHYDRIRWIPNVFLGLSFFATASFLKDYINMKKFSRIAFIIFLFLFFLSVFTLPASNFAANSIKGHPVFFFLWFVFSIVAIILIKMLCVTFDFLNPKSLLYLGKCSMTYYVCHWPILYIMIYIFNSSLSGYYLYFIVLITTLVFCFLIDMILSKTKFKFILGL